ncbi:MAG: prepilin-type N-terminal cleavage/methylation domain-containing protein, partial [Gemmatimonadaceae bacterium]
ISMTRQTRRRGFTLMEMAVCMVIMAVAAAVVAPAISRLGDGQPETGGDKLVALLKQARNYAIERNYLVTVRLDPVTSRYRVDTTGLSGMGVLADTTLDLGDSETLESELDRLLFTFQPSGAAMADSVIVRGIGTTSMLSVDPWTGEAKLVAR